MSEHDNNPYAPPVAIVSDEEQFPDEGNYIPGGRQVPAGNGSAWIGSAWEMFKQSPGPWIGMFVVMTLLIMLSGFVPFASYLLAPIFMGGIMIACERQRESGELSFNDLFAGFQDHGGPLCLVGLLQLAFAFVLMIPAGIIVVIGIAVASASGVFDGGLSAAGFMPIMLGIGGGLLLVFTIGFLVMAATWFAPALVVHQGLSPFEAMKASFSACMKNWASGFIYSILGFLLVILSLIPLGLGLLVVMPIFYASIYTSYRDIFIED